MREGVSARISLRLSQGEAGRQTGLDSIAPAGTDEGCALLRAPLTVKGEFLLTEEIFFKSFFS
jgi:hypothetical protein